MDTLIGLAVLAAVAWLWASARDAWRNAGQHHADGATRSPRPAAPPRPDPLEQERREAGAYFDGLIIGGLWLGDRLHDHGEAAAFADEHDPWIDGDDADDAFHDDTFDDGWDGW